MKDEDGLIILGIGILAFFLWNRQAATVPAGTTTPGTTAPIKAGCDSCGGGGGATTPGEPVGKPSAVTCYGGQILREGVCINPYSETPRLGSANNDAVLAEIIRQLEASNAAGTWDLSWQIAAKRDAWIKSQGY